MIPFNLPMVVGNEAQYLQDVLKNKKLSGDGTFNKKASALIKERTGSLYVTLTPSCTAALEMAYLLIDLQPGDEVILPSFTFTSSATAIVLFGATPVFVDIDQSMNLDIDQVLKAVTAKTKAVCVVHYASTSCDLDLLRARLPKHIYIVEDAAQAIGATYKGRALGSIGELGAYSFHETKNVLCGEGGALLVNHPDLVARAEILKDKGTNRQKFLRGEVDKYTWQDKGSSYLLPELAAAYLLAQLEKQDDINAKRLKLWNLYFAKLNTLASEKTFQLPVIPDHNLQNAHIFYLILANPQMAVNLALHLKKQNIQAVSHYVPLHNSPAGKRFGRTGENLANTEHKAAALIRLPLFYDLSENEIEIISSAVLNFFK
ncbi:MAG: dTDP-4-amino-4,6-dideoxygalactose transaminase [Bdellovibrio sp.]|nr:dTDP-4-amino-4,6-dideoxygalactose transaminase [Bdellovibrio sp.]